MRSTLCYNDCRRTNTRKIRTFFLGDINSFVVVVVVASTTDTHSLARLLVNINVSHVVTFNVALVVT